MEMVHERLTDPNKFDQVVSKVSGKLDSKHGSQSKFRVFSARVKATILPVLPQAKAFTMALSRLDPHGVAPFVCAGVFFALEVGPLDLPVPKITS